MGPLAHFLADASGWEIVETGWESVETRELRTIATGRYRLRQNVIAWTRKSPS